jgi:MFS family permease
MSSYFQFVRGLNRDVRLLLITSALVGFATFGGITSVLGNLYLLRLGFGVEFIGVYIAAGLIAFSALCLPAGAFSARWGDRRVTAAGLGVLTLGTLMISLVELLPEGARGGWLLASNIVGSGGIAVYFVSSNLYLTAATTPAARGHAFSIQGGIWPLAGFGGSLIGGALPGALAALFGSDLLDPAVYRYAILFAALLLLPGIAAMLRTGEIAVRRPEADASGARAKAPLGIILLLGAVGLLQMAGEGVARNFMNVYLDSGLNMAPAQIGTLLAFAQLLATPAALATPLIVTRIGRNPTFIAASIGIGLSLLPIGLFGHWAIAGLGYLGVMIAGSVRRPAVLVMQMESVAPPWRPAMSAVSTMSAGLGGALIAISGGLIISRLGFAWLFAIGAAFSLAGVLLFIVAFRSGSAADRAAQAARIADAEIS